jgi:ankyrin repeat protein
MFSFIRKRLKQAALFRAIYERDVERILELVRSGLDLNFVMHGSSPLSRAVWRLEDWKVPDRRVVDLLLEHGALPGKPGNDTLLTAAARVGDHQLIDLALAAGQDIHRVFRGTPTPLQVAAFKNRPDTIRYLAARGATKEDFGFRCRWTSINPSTITALLDLGVPVPDDIVERTRQDKESTTNS